MQGIEGVYMFNPFPEIQAAGYGDYLDIREFLSEAMDGLNAAFV